MELFLQRHGIAEFAHKGGSDFERELTREGRTLLRRQATGLKKIVSPEILILHSPYRRAVQTAEILAGELGLQKVEEMILGCGCRLEDIWEVLSLHSNPEKAWVVGHQPDLGNITFALTRQSISVQPGTLIQLEAYPQSTQKSHFIRVLHPEDQVALSS